MNLQNPLIQEIAKVFGTSEEAARKWQCKKIAAK
jgi:hypothetical protein